MFAKKIYHLPAAMAIPNRRSKTLPWLGTLWAAILANAQPPATDRLVSTVTKRVFLAMMLKTDANLGILANLQARDSGFLVTVT